MNSVSGKVLGVTEQASYFLSNYKLNFSFQMLLDIFIVAILLYWVYIFLRETRAMRILYGLIFLLVLMAIGRILDLVLLNWILKYTMTGLVVAIPIVFQPELRGALERLGRSKFIGEFGFIKSNYEKILEEIVKAVAILARQRIGALIVIQRQTGLREYIERGIEIDSTVSSEIIQSIFFPKSPLHDGAIIIAGDKIVSASSILPVSESITPSELGTRHRAAIGVTENSDAIAIVVSEETGSISLAVGGRLERRLSDERLLARLVSLIKQNKKK